MKMRNVDPVHLVYVARITKRKWSLEFELKRNDTLRYDAKRCDIIRYVYDIMRSKTTQYNDVIQFGTMHDSIS